MARGRQQRAHERLLPRQVFEADEARRRAWRACGDDSDDSTVGDDDDEDGGLIVQVGQGNDDLEDEEVNEETINDTLKATIRRSTTFMFRCVLMFSE